MKNRTSTHRALSLLLAWVVVGLPSSSSARSAAEGVFSEPDERPDDPYIAVRPEDRITSPARRWARGEHVSVQVNVDESGQNIVGDAANETSIAVDPNNPNRMAIGWRQFDTIASNFRQAGYGYTVDGGATWTFPGAIDPGLFRSDPVLDVAADGTFYYYSLEDDLTCDIFESSDGGASWGPEIYAFGGDKAWLAVDRTGGPGDGHLYTAWSPVGGCCNPDMFNRSTDAGATFEPPVSINGNPRRGVTAVGPQGEVYVVGHLSASMSQFMIAKSTTVQDPKAGLGFDFTAAVDLGGALARAVGPNPAGMLGQVWVAAGPAVTQGDGVVGAPPVYILASIDPPGADPLDIHFVRSTDGGATFSAPIRVNDDPSDSGAWQWFGTLAVAPDGRLDAVWNDSRADPGGFDSELYYAYSRDGGITWSANQPLSPPFDPHLGWPQQNKIGDYYHMVSDNTGAHLAYSATFNGEQDVYYLRIEPADLFSDGFESGDTSAWD